MRFFLVALVSVAGLAGGACGGSGGNALPTGPTPVSANVEFVVTTRTRASGASASEAPSACAGLVRLHPSWWSFAHVTMVATDQDRFGLYFDQVPVGRQSVRLTVPEGCESTGLIANGVFLAAGETGAYAFTIDSDGRITS